MASVHEPVEGLRAVERARGQVWHAYFSSWIWYVVAAEMVVFGLVEDFAPDWVGKYVLIGLLLCLVLAVLWRTRRGRVLLRLPAVPRSAVLGTGHRGTPRSQLLLMAVWTTSIALGGVMFIAMFVSVAEANRAGGGGEPADPPVPYTVLYTALALICLGISVIGRRWAQRKIDGHGNG